MDRGILGWLRQRLFSRFSSRLVLVILLVSLVPLAASTYVSSTQTQAALDEQAFEVQKEAATRIAENAQSRSEFFKRQAALIQENPHVRELVVHRYRNETLANATAGAELGAGYPQAFADNETYQQTQQYFGEVAAENPSMEMIRVFWRDGNVLTGQKFGQEDRRDYAGNRYWFQQTMSREETPPDTVYASALNIETTTDGQGQPMIRYAVPIQVDGERVAVVVINYASEQITEPVSTIQVGDNGYAALLDTNHVNADGEQQGPVYIANGRDPFLTYVPGLDTIPVPDDGPASGRTTYEEEGENWIAHYKRVTLAGGWEYYAVVTQPAEELMAPSQQILENGLILVGVSVPILLLVGVVASRRIAKPIEQFAKDAEQVAEGDLDHEITQPSSNSVHELHQMTGAAKRMKAELVSALEYEEIFDSIRDPILVYSLESDQLLTVNRATEETLGYEARDLEGAGLDVFTPADASGDLESVPDRIHDEDPLLFEARFETNAGETVPVAVNATRIAYYGTDAILGVVRDISSQKTKQRQLKQTKEELEELNTRLQLALEETDTGVWSWDRPTDTVRWDETSDRLFGYDPGTFPGTFESFANRIPDDDLQQIEQQVDHAIETGEQYRAEFRVQPPEGDQRWIQARGVVRYDDTGDPKRLLGIQTDITDRKEREQTLQETKAELESSNEKLEQFAYVASHDLQEPLRMISSYMELLELELGDELDDEAQEYMEFAVDGADRMQAMIDGLLQYSRVQTRADPFETVDSDAVLDETLQDLELKIVDADAEIERDTLPTVTADRNQLGQVFQNLVKNAIDHGTENTTIEITATERAEATTFAVADDGPGIPADRQADIFDIFNKGGDSDGTGIGLAVCQQIVERHGGEIWVDSTEGEGTTFHFTISDDPDQSESIPS